MGGAGSYDVAVVGAGHNGLVAAFYLARAGLKVVVVERRDIVGGACVTEEFAPGFRASTGAYILSMLRPAIWKDLRLRERGVVTDDAGPSLNLFPDGADLLLDDDPDLAAEAVRRFSPADAQALPEVEDQLLRLAGLLVPTFDLTAFNVGDLHRRDSRTLTSMLRSAVRSRKDLDEALFLMTTSADHYLSERFESPYVKAALGWHSINDSLNGPSTLGTAYVLLHDHVSHEPGGGLRRWGFVRGGMGQVTVKMAEAAREAGAEIRTGVEVDRILTRGTGESVTASGLALSDGSEVDSRIVLSNADPRRTFETLCDPGDLPAEFLRAVRNIRSDGTSIKINLALDALPAAAAVPGTGPQPYHHGVLELGPTLDVLDRQQADARVGVAATGAHIEMCFPTVHDPSLAPEGKHVATIDVNSQPYSLAEGNWDSIKDGVADRVLQELDGYFPGLSSSVLHRQVLSPLDLERIIGITGGHALHGEMAPDQLFMNRPVRGYADYRTPIAGLYLCGAGTHPGGGVSGANGRNCAGEALRDLRGGWLRRRLHDRKR
ncbi:MAG TPA: NAD(P)/FAD-dependent oxidoreductase [Nocardioides sp.]|nr:NAD(P)/FAD-dependent oxidoreductase [Nocardioides sp.]